MVKCTKKQIRELKTALRWKIPAAQRERIQMVLLREGGMTQPAIAEAMGVSLSTVNRAHMAYDGGGIKALTKLTLDSVVLTQNATTGTAFTTGGGGVYMGGLGTLVIRNSTVSGNTANAGSVTATQIGQTSGNGGGIFINAGTAVIMGSFIDDNTANSASARSNR